MNFCVKCHDLKQTIKHRIIPDRHYKLAHPPTINLCSKCKADISRLYPRKKMERRFYLEVVSAFLLGRDPIVRIVDEEYRKKSR